MTVIDLKKLKLEVEAILFSYGDWIASGEIMNILNLDSELELNKVLNEIEEKYDGVIYPFKVECDVESRWRMVLKEEFEDVVSGVISNVEIPNAVIKVLSVIAYEQPVTKTRLLEILGKSVKGEVDYLFKNGFLSYEKRGVGKYYRVTKKFYDYFKLDENSDFRREANKNIKTFLESSQVATEKIDEDKDL
ncbi:MAG: SMC-Scp complex subunit ScpB [Nanoarchaeota archaeon]|nr:SMC-Scp complex subunit ScpB [Nanoarchaeota archaeon]